MLIEPLEQILLLAGLFLLIAAAGFLFGRWGDGEDDDSSQAQPLNSEYLKGLNFLLNDQNDQALEHFIRLVRVDDQTIETHFALGSLFRRRGEVDRAIRVHQNIIARPDLPSKQRDQALFSLAKDYLHAGLLDRAENLFAQLAERSDFRIESLTQLCNIYEQEQEWQNAVIAARQLETARAPGAVERLTNYYCELASRALARGDLAAAKENVRLSQAGRSRITRGAILRAEIALKEGDRKLAKRLLGRVLEEHSNYLIELLPRLNALYVTNGDAGELDAALQEMIAARPEASQDIARAALQWPEVRSDLIDECVEAFIRNDRVLRRFVDVDAIVAAEEGASERALERIREALAALAQTAPRYRCEQCGFSSRQLLWQCPGCRNWESLKPLVEVRFDTLLEQGGGVNY